MNQIESLFKYRPGKKELETILSKVIQEKDLFDKLTDLVIQHKKFKNIGPSWALGFAGVKRPIWFLERLDELIDSTDSNTPDCVFRAISRVLRDIEIPEKYIGTATYICFQWVSDPEQSIAVKAFCLHTLSHILLKEPEIANELRVITESLMPNASSGLLNTCQKVLRRIEKLER
ncbi:MAG: hypothetical protein H6605_01325 [Flavobacteriales bacterium]|nr:hypothetical protein [Flavobacteriales bacterium]